MGCRIKLFIYFIEYRIQYDIICNVIPVIIYADIIFYFQMTSNGLIYYHLWSVFIDFGERKTVLFAVICVVFESYVLWFILCNSHICIYIYIYIYARRIVSCDISLLTHTPHIPQARAWAASRLFSSIPSVTALARAKWTAWAPRGEFSCLVCNCCDISILCMLFCGISSVWDTSWYQQMNLVFHGYHMVHAIYVIISHCSVIYIVWYDSPYIT
jgi:hypothetical protein